MNAWQAPGTSTSSTWTAPAPADGVHSDLIKAIRRRVDGDTWRSEAASAQKRTSHTTTRIGVRRRHRWHEGPGGHGILPGPCRGSGNIVLGLDLLEGQADGQKDGRRRRPASLEELLERADRRGHGDTLHEHRTGRHLSGPDFDAIRQMQNDDRPPDDRQRRGEQRRGPRPAQGDGRRGQRSSARPIYEGRIQD